MALLFVGGVMNLAWVAAITVFVAAEKLAPQGRVGGVGPAASPWSPPASYLLAAP